MFRVLLKIAKVNLRVIEAVQLHILIRKDHRFFTYCRGEPLANGEAHPTHSAEFLIDANSPRFEIEIFLITGDARKRGGVVPINLKAFTINASHSTVEPIRKTPLKHCSVELELVYMRSEYRLEESLMSVGRLQEMIHSSRIRAVIDEHEKLIFRNNSLSNEVEQLRQANAALLTQQHALQHSLSQKEQQYSRQELLLITQTSHGTPNNMRKLVEFARDIQQQAEAALEGQQEELQGGEEGEEEPAGEGAGLKPPPRHAEEEPEVLHKEK